MRPRISLDDDLVRQIDRRVGVANRSAFIARAVRRSLNEERRWEDIEAGLGAISDSGHEWDADPAGWVAAQRGRHTAQHAR